HAGAIARRLVVVPVADQQEGEDAGEFPEDNQEDQVSGQDDAQHRTRKGQEEEVEATYRILRRDVVAGIEDDQESDAADEEGEDPAEPVHPEGEVETQRWNPLDPVPDAC